MDLFRIEQEMTVGSNGTGPVADPLPSLLPPRLGPDGLVVVQVVGEVILDEVFARHAKVNRVPVRKLPSQLPRKWRVKLNPVP